MISKHNLLIIQPKIPNYRIPIFNLLSQIYEVTILHSGNKIEDSNCSFKQIVVGQLVFGPFLIQKANLYRICNQYDIIMSEGNIRYLLLNLLVFNKFRKYKWIFWGIGVSASYNKKFDQQKNLDSIRHFIFKQADCNIFYSNYPIKKYLAAGFKKSSLFVADNTTAVTFSEDALYEKDSILFIGTLYKEKKIFDLLEAFESAFLMLKGVVPLYIIGNGDEFSKIQKWIESRNFQNVIMLVGEVFDNKLLEIYFRKALACISPGQAGLSVLTSMGNGTPFICQKDAITGGEIFNITDQVNGVLYENKLDLIKIIIDINNNKEKYIEMGSNARKYYLKYRKPDQMVDGFISAINSLIN